MSNDQTNRFKKVREVEIEEKRFIEEIGLWKDNVWEGIKSLPQYYVIIDENAGIIRLFDQDVGVGAGRLLLDEILIRVEGLKDLIQRRGCSVQFVHDRSSRSDSAFNVTTHCVGSSLDDAKMIENKSKTLEKICEWYEKCMIELERAERVRKLESHINGFDYLYEHTLQCHPKIGCTSDDIKEFSLELSRYQKASRFEDFTGLYLSSLINSSEDQNFTIMTRHLDKKINFMGYNNVKLVEIQGDAGHWLGQGNKGKIIIKGDVGAFLGACNEGTIIVEGNTESGAGGYNKGEIFIKGNAGGEVGHRNDGKILVEGNIKSGPRRLCGGRGEINVRGKLYQ